MRRAYTDVLRPCVLGRKMVGSLELELRKLAIFAVWRSMGTTTKRNEIKSNVERRHCSCGKKEVRKPIAASLMARREFK